ncbi:MAG: uroporphyrinogen decarboxylase [Actinobacteria bacterium]|nr:MAG: uroporphyrinogen decarboxylase [Actinomycetota bacterium]
MLSASELAPEGRGGARNERFLAACARRPVDATPVWMMRQAGRSLPAYRELRQRYGLVEITREPELCAEVTLMPIRVLDVDAAIMFADIMLPLAGLGVRFELVEDLGPVVADPIRSPAQVAAMATPSARESVPTVLEAIGIIRRELEGVVPLIGFSGAPFTLASYLIEGRPSRDFSRTKALMFTDPGTWHNLMERLTAMVIDYLSEQVAAGVQALQLFDSWVGALGPRDYAEFVAPHTSAIFDATAALGVPRIHFGTNTATLLEAMATPGAEDSGPEVVGVDWRIPLDVAWERIGRDRAVQGNLEPAALLGPPATVVERTEAVLRAAGGRPGHIFNLGHGVLPDSPLDNLKLMVDTVHAFSNREQKEQRDQKDER